MIKTFSGHYSTVCMYACIYTNVCVYGNIIKTNRNFGCIIYCLVEIIISIVALTDGVNFSSYATTRCCRTKWRLTYSIRKLFMEF